MECILAEGIKLGKSKFCPFKQVPCEGIMNVEWEKDYAMIPECKVCINQSNKSSCVEVTKDDLSKLIVGEGVLMARTEGGGVCFIKVCPE